MHAEKLSFIGPDAAGPPARRARQILKLADREFVRVFGVDRFSKAERELAATNACDLVPQADEVHFNAAFTGIVNCFVPERIEIERAFEFAIDPHQKIKIESRRDASSIIIGADKRAWVLLQVNADNKPPAWRKDSAHRARQASIRSTMLPSSAKHAAISGPPKPLPPSIDAA